MHSKQFAEKMKERLQEEKERLQEQMQATPAHVEMDQDRDDTSEEIEVDEVNQDILAQLKQDIKKIDEALARIDAGTYGVDVVSGEDIPEARLEVIPWAETTAENEGK